MARFSSSLLKPYCCMRLASGHQRAEALGDLAFRHHRFDLEQLERAADAAGAGLRAEERRVRAARDVAQPQVEHLRHQVLDERLAIAADGLVVLGLALERRPTPTSPALPGSVDMLISVSLCAGTLVSTVAGGALRRGNAAEVLAAPVFSASATGMSPTTTTAMLIGAIPLLVEREQPLARRVLQDLGQADRQALGVARALEDHRQLLVGQARAGAEPAAPFLEDDAAFLFDFGGQQRDAGGEILQHQHAAIDVARPDRSGCRACRWFRRTTSRR